MKSNHRTQTHKIKSPRRQALPPYRRQHSEGEVDFVSSGIWALKFPTDEPWRGGAQIMKQREIEATGKREEESERGERRKKKEEKNKKEKKRPLRIKK